MIVNLQTNNVIELSLLLNFKLNFFFNFLTAAVL